MEFSDVEVISILWTITDKEYSIKLSKYQHHPSITSSQDGQNPNEKIDDINVQ